MIENKKFELYKFTFRKYDNTNYESQYVIAEHYAAAFGLLFESNGDEIDIYSMEKIAREKIDLIIDPYYVTSKIPNDPVIVKGFNDYEGE